MSRKKGAFLMSLNKSFFLVLLFTLFQNINSESTVSGKTVQASDSMVVTRHFLATEVGNTILQNGGNAIDASVAISFALSVVLPQAAPIGGGGCTVIHEANTNQNYYDPYYGYNYAGKYFIFNFVLFLFWEILKKNLP